jgi:hypothetical protein
MLKTELDEYQGYENHGPEARNGYYRKKTKTESLGDLALNIPCDRNNEFAPKFILKGQRMSDKLEGAIIGMYSRGYDYVHNDVSCYPMRIERIMTDYLCLPVHYFHFVSIFQKKLTICRTFLCHFIYHAVA